MIRRDTCRTLAYAVELFRSMRAQGYSPSLVVGAGEFVVQVWRIAPFVLVTLLLQSCIAYKPPLSNEDLVRHAKICQDAGLDIRTINSENYEVLDFQCVPKGAK